MKSKNSKLGCIDLKSEKLMLKEIEKAELAKDSLGGIFELWIEGLPCGLGTFAHFDKRLDAILCGYLMSIPGVKAVEAGLGFQYASSRGSKTHDEIFYSKTRGFYRKTNHSGGIEGGISTGEAVVLRAGMKPIATLKKPLNSVNLTTKKKTPAIVERSDTCAILACSVIGENMAALAITQAFVEKFGSDSLAQIRTNYQNYIKNLDNL
jgi:chorismate synthase